MAATEEESPAERLYERYKIAAIEHCAEWLQTGPNKPLTQVQQKRRDFWFKILRQFDPNCPLPAIASVNDLQTCIGGGVWRVDYTHEKIFYADIWSNTNCLQKSEKLKTIFQKDIRESMMRIPFGEGTIGYVVENVRSFIVRQDKDVSDYGVYLADNSIGDLRGVVAFEDHIIGQVNTLLVPILPIGAGGGSADVRLVLSLFLPVPGVLNMDYAKSFAAKVEPIGQMILIHWERAFYRDVKRVIPVRPPNPSDQLYASLDDIAESVARVEPTLAQDGHVAFPFVALLQTNPMADPIGPLDRGPENAELPFKSWIEPISFFQSHNLGVTRGMIHDGWSESNPVSWEGRKELAVFCTTANVDHGKARRSTDRHTSSPCMPNVVDLVIPLAHGKDVVGQIRMNVSLPLLKKHRGNTSRGRFLDTLTARLEQDAKLSAARADAARIVFILRQSAVRQPIALKLQREIEQRLLNLLFDKMDGADDGGGKVTGLQDRGLEDLIWLFRKVVFEASSTLRLEDDIAAIVRPFITDIPKRLRDALVDAQWKLYDSVLGYTYWAWERQLTLNTPTNEQITTPAPVDWHNPQLQTALTLLILGRNDEGADGEIVYDGELRGRFVEDHGNSEDVLLRRMNFHLPLNTTDVSSRSVISHASKIRWKLLGPEMKTFRVQILEDHDVHSAADWVIRPQWPRIAAAHFVGEGSVKAVEQLRRHFEATQRFDFERKRRRNQIRVAFVELAPIKSRSTRAQSLTLDLDHRHVNSEARCIQKLLNILAGEQIRSLKHIFCYPAQVSAHVYSWLLIGVRFDSPDLSDRYAATLALRETALDQIREQVTFAAIEAERRLLHAAYVVAQEGKDFQHSISDPATETANKLVELAEQPSEQLNANAQMAVELTVCAKRIQAIAAWARFAVLPLIQFNNLGQHLEVAIFGARQRFALKHQYDFQQSSVRRQDENSFETPGVASHDDLEPYFNRLENRSCGEELRRVRFAKDLHEDVLRLLSFLWTDLICNAVAHSDRSENVSISWCSIDHTITFANPIGSKVSQARLKEAARQLNNVMLFDAPFTVQTFQTFGLRNIATWAIRLRVGLNCTIDLESRVFSVSAYIGHLL